MSNAIASVTCFACKESANYLTAWKYSGLNDSVFNYTAQFYACEHCGLVFIHNISDDVLSLFYKEECSYHEKAHFDISSPENIKKYQLYADFIEQADLSKVPIADIGCGRGGFLFWLANNNPQAKHVGVDIDVKSIPSSNINGTLLSFQEGKAIDLPFADNSQSLLSYFHVLEHIKNIDDVLSEAARVLEDDGHIMLEVPDAERYQDYPVGTAFWFSIREHIYHFSACSLSQVLNRHGFEIVTISRQEFPTPEFSYPSLVILGRKHGSKIKRQSKCDFSAIGNYLLSSQEELTRQANKILALSLRSLLTFWGLSAELYSLLPLLDIKEGYQLCDSSKLKQSGQYKHLAILPPDSVKPNGTLVISPYLHRDAIYDAAISFGWPLENIFHLS